MKRSNLAFAIATAIMFTAATAFAAQGKGHGGGPKPKPATKAVGAPKAHGQTAKVTGQGKVKTHTTTAKSGSTSDSPTPGGNKKSRSSQVGTSGLVLTPVQEKLTKNTNLASKLSGRLPAGTDLMLASEGFRNLGQFVAAVNVSNNLGIPFADLKARMVTDGLSLGQAIKAERSDVDFLAQARRAETDADLLIQTTEVQTAKKPKKK